MSGSITQRQREILESIRDGSVPEDPPTGYRISARALANRRLVAIYGHGDEWYVELTDAGRHYLETGDYPGGCPYGLRQAAIGVTGRPGW
ncbi:hypothetical protein EDC82_2252 [Dermacoccus sp. SAI-028]|nr:hypothetical protein EDC82_2252 [Dermacoccus sp. SAI-028]